MDPVSCVSCVSWVRWMNAGETHETFRQESGMRYHSTTTCRALLASYMTPCGSDPTRMTKSHGWTLICTLSRMPLIRDKGMPPARIQPNRELWIRRPGRERSNPVLSGFRSVPEDAAYGCKPRPG
jgi:hypothetical protein